MDEALKHILTNLTIKAVAGLYHTDMKGIVLSFQETRKEFKGDITLVTFPLVAISKKSPEQTAREIGEYLEQHVEEVSSFEVVKGFLNIRMSDTYWLACLHELSEEKAYGRHSRNGKKVMVEYSSPNTNKPLHLGHVRNNVLGFSLAEILDAAGYEVFKTCLVNDRGIHICKSMIAWQKYGNDETPESAGLKGDHLVGKYYVIFDQEYKKEIVSLVATGSTEEEAKKVAPLILETQAMLLAWEAHDPEVLALWKRMNAWVYAGFEQTYSRLGVTFDKYYYESDTYKLGKDLIEQGLDSNVFFKKTDGSVWIDLTADGLDEKVVLRADGTSVYITQDLGTAVLKEADFGMDQSIYVVGNEQDYHFKVLFLILKKLGLPWANGLLHMSYGMVDLPGGKMKSREGTVVDADDLMDEMQETARIKTEELGKTDDFSDAEKSSLNRKIGMGALKYFLLKVDPRKRLLFDPAESIDFQGNTGPFIQYSYARIKSILRKESNILRYKGEFFEMNEDERSLIKLLYSYRETVYTAAQEFSPAVIAAYLYDLGKSFNRFYHENQVLKAEDEITRQFRLNLCLQTGLIIKSGMTLLGIEVPEKM